MVLLPFVKGGWEGFLIVTVFKNSCTELDELCMKQQNRYGLIDVETIIHGGKICHFKALPWKPMKESPH